jgi:LIVCS family branched-chain amino acid:cation transporter
MSSSRAATKADADKQVATGPASYGPVKINDKGVFMEATNLAKDAKAGNEFANILFIGFMVFATFFGAGNMIFPAYLGVVGGSEWLGGLVAFVLADAVLGVLALAASAKFPRTVMGTYYRAGFKFMVIWGGIGIFLGSVIAVIPRTGLVTFETGVSPIINLITGGSSRAGAGAFIPFYIIYYVLACLCVINPTRIIDVLGKWLTPSLIIVLFILYIMGYVAGGTGVREGAIPEAVGAYNGSVFGFGLSEGYQTMDSFTGALFAIVIVNALAAKGYTKATDQQKMIYQSGIVATIACFVLYLGLTGLGVIHSANPELVEMAKAGDRTGILNYIVRTELGGPGIIILALVVLMATFTTAVGAGSMVATFFSTSLQKFFGGKLTYKVCTVICFAFALVMAILMSTGFSSGVTAIINLMTPMLLITTPVLCGTVVGTLVGSWCKNDNIVRGSIVGAAIPGIIDSVVISTFMFTGNWIGAGVPGLWGTLHGFFHAAWNPLALYNLTWVFPVIVCTAIGAFVPWKGFTERPFLREHSDQLHLDYYEALEQIKKK